MHDRKSLYSRNKRNSRAILCPDAFEQDHPLMPEQFLRRSFGSGKRGRMRITTTGSLQIIFTQTTHRPLRNIPPQSRLRKKQFLPALTDGRA